MKCPKCGWIGKQYDKFCLLCGSRLEEVAVFPEKAKEKVCRSCGKTLFDEDIFCGFCGTRVQKQDDCEQIQPKNEVEDLFVAENKKDDQNVVQSTVVDEIKEQSVLADNVTSESDIVEKQEQKEKKKQETAVQKQTSFPQPLQFSSLN